MAKVEIEDRAFNAPKLRTAVYLKRVPSALILGHALILWRMSQQEEKVTATREQIEAWLDVDRYSRPKAAFDLLVSAGYLELVSENEWKIDGNSWRIPRIAARKKSAVAAITARYNKKSSYDPYTGRTTRRIPDIKTGIQHDKIANMPEICLTSPASPPEPKGGDVWTAYATAYFLRYSVQPVRNARTNSLCKQLIKRLGADGAISVVKFFLTHGKGFYVAKAHDLGLCVADAEALHTQWKGNHRITQTEANSTDRSAGNLAAASFVLDKIKRGEI
jgi:hypothetical protein